MRHTAKTPLLFIALIGLLFATACQSAPEPRKDTPKLRSGSEIATSTGDQTRAALEKEPGLVLYASSIPDEDTGKSGGAPESQPRVPESQPSSLPDEPKVPESQPKETSAPESQPSPAADASETPAKKAETKEKGEDKKDAKKPADL